MRSIMKKSYFIKKRILPVLLILPVVFFGMISMFSLNGVNAASDTATAGETFYIDVSQNTKWNVSASTTYDLYASFVKGNTILANQVCTYNVGGNSNICSVVTPAAAAGADKINLFVAPKGTTFPSTTSDTGYTRVYFQNTANWSSVYAYAWDSNGNYNKVFPGAAMTRVSSTSNYYYYDVNNSYDNIIFSNGSNAAQTKDLIVPSTNNSLYVWNTSNTSSTQWSTTPYILYDATAVLTNRESGANHIYIISGDNAALSRYKYGWLPTNTNVSMMTVYLYNLNWYSSGGAAPYVTYDYNDSFLRYTAQMQHVAGEPGFYKVQVPVGSKIVFKRTETTTTQVSAQTNVPTPTSYNEPCYVMNTTERWREKGQALDSYYDYFAEDNFHQSNIFGVEATYFDYLTDEELKINGDWLKPIKAGTDGNDKGGATDDWFPFDNFNNAISNYASTNSWKYPLYFGNFCNTSDAYNYSNHSGPYYTAVSGLTNFLYPVNNSNGLVDRYGRMETTEALSSSVHGLVHKELDANGNLQFASGKKVPFFDGDWLNRTKVNGKSIGKTVKSFFPFEAKTTGSGNNQVTTYTFNSASASDNRYDNVYFTWKNGVPDKVNYGSDTNSSTKRYSIQDGKQNFLGQTPGYGLFPFNNTSYENSYEDANNPGNGNLNYGFGIRLDIDFRVPANGKLANGRDDVTFNFKGDDDIWIYITDPETNQSQLVLDLGGVHSYTEGKINFNTMKSTDTNANTLTGAPYTADRMYITDSYPWGQIYVYAFNSSTDYDWYKAQYDSSVDKYYVSRSQPGIYTGKALSTKKSFKPAKDTNWSLQSPNDGTIKYGVNTYTDNPSYTDTKGINTQSPVTYSSAFTQNFGFEPNGSDAYGTTYKQLDPDKTYHMTVFYMERGMIESNFNVDFTMTPANTDVKVNKEVIAENVNPGLASAVKNLNTDFEFTPYENSSQVSGNNTLAYTVNDSDTKQYVSVSNPTFKLKNGDTADFNKEFTLGSKIKFTEQAPDNGLRYDTTWEVWDVKNDKKVKPDSGTGTGTTSGEFTLVNSVNPDDDAEFLVNFVNKPQTKDVSLTKLVQDEKGEELGSDEISDTFGFYVTVDLGDGTYRPYPLSYNIDYYGGGSAVLNTRSSDGYLTFSTGDKVTLKNIPVGAKIKVVEATKAGYLPVSCKITGSESVSNNFATNRTVEAKVVSGNNSNSLVFTNKQNTTSATLNAKKLLDGGNYSGSLFSFELKGLASINTDTVTTKDVSGQSLTVKSVSDGDITFKGSASNKILSYSEPGVYRYKIYEKSLDNNDYITDKKVYLVEITVKENGASLVPEAVYYKTPETVTSSTSDANLHQYFVSDNELNSVPVFDNNTQKGKVTVIKTDQSDQLVQGVQFTIYKTTGENEALGEEYDTKTTDEDGQIIFDGIKIFKDGYQSSTPEYQWYCLVESAPKDGYSISAEKHYFKLPTKGSYEIKFEYVNGVVIMPDASGIGTRGFIVMGACILAFGAMLLMGYFFTGYKAKRRIK